MSEIKDKAKDEIKEWTLMFYFASDNPLAPGIVSQLKAIKNAGYHPEVNVVAYFDPQPPGTPAHVFDVNAIYKLKTRKPKIGFVSNDPYIRNLLEDRLWRDDEKSRNGKTIRERLEVLMAKQDIVYALPRLPLPPLPSNGASQTSIQHHDGQKADKDNEPGPSLDDFLRLCAEKYKAKHYMLFILGHGLVVGNDAFLYDEHAAKHSVTLKELGVALHTFKKNIRTHVPGAQFELVSFHSCSMSSLEVAYQLQDTAKYMLASQGPAFVASWPYSQILIRVFNELGHKPKYNTRINIKRMLTRIFYSVLHNSTDFLLAGYSFDVCLCDLRKSAFKAIGGLLEDLFEELIQGLADPMVTNCMLLAHLQSQSYWQENYTDLYDFCLCLRKYCKQFSDATGSGSTAPYERIRRKCAKIMAVLHSSKHPDNPVVLAEFAGPSSQYSHGLSVFFPWTRPTADRKIIEDYRGYAFNNLGAKRGASWFDFLDRYWGPENFLKSVKGSTMRESHGNENQYDPNAHAVMLTESEALREDMISLMFNADGPLNRDGVLDDGVKTHPRDPTGDECTCGSIKNYMHDTRRRSQRLKSVEQRIPLSSPFPGKQGAV